MKPSYWFHLWGYKKKAFWCIRWWCNLCFLAQTKDLFSLRLKSGVHEGGQSCWGSKWVPYPSCSFPSWSLHFWEIQVGSLNNYSLDLQKKLILEKALKVLSSLFFPFGGSSESSIYSFNLSFHCTQGQSVISVCFSNFVQHTANKYQVTEAKVDFMQEAMFPFLAIHF